MVKTEQRTMRLSRFHSKIVEQVQESLGITFTDAMRHIITEYDHEQNEIKRRLKTLRELERKFYEISTNSGSFVNSQEIGEDLNEIKGDTFLIKQALKIIGDCDPRTKIAINNLLKAKK